MGMDVDIDHSTVFLDDVPDLHTREGKNGLKLWGMLCVEMYSERRAKVSGSSITRRYLFYVISIASSISHPIFLPNLIVLTCFLGFFIILS